MRDSVLRAEIRGPDSRFSEHTCLWLLVPAPGCEPKLTITADVKWQGHIQTQRKAILVGSTLAELEYRVQSPRLLASRISSSSRKPVYAGPPLQPAGLHQPFPSQPLYLGHPQTAYSHCSYHITSFSKHVSRTYCVLRPQRAYNLRTHLKMYLLAHHCDDTNVPLFLISGCFIYLILSLK